MNKTLSTNRLSTSYVKIILGLLLIFLLLTFGAARIFSATPNLVINEILVSNVSLERDPKFNNFSGWIEIYNAGSTSITLTGYTLTDNLSNPTQWSIPRQSIAPGEHIIFWTDEENKSNHTNFKLNHRGEAVGLFTPAGELVDSLTFGGQVRNVSYGRQSDGSTTWVYFQNPTPAGANNTPGLPDTDQAGEPQFSPIGGFFNSSFTLNITPPSPSALVTYTLDGSEPQANSTQATGGIPISKTTVVRARAFENGVLNGPVITQSYFVNEGTTLPVVSLVTDPDNFFGDYNGIYVIGKNGIDGPCVDYKANYFQAWERPLSVEFFEQNGTPGFKFDSAVEIQGGCSRNQPIKGLDIKLSYKYGINKFTYDLFPDIDQKLFKAFLLRPSSSDQSKNMFKDGMVQNLSQNRMDVDDQAYRAVALFINGKYWGINNIREKLNDDYIDIYHNETDIDLLKPQFNIMDIKNGDRAAYDALSNYISSHNLSIDANYAYVADRIDINEYINYQIAQIYSGTHDWPHNNIRMWRPREELGKWRWMRYDLDSSFKDPARDSIVWATDPNATYAWSTLYLRKLLANEGFRNEFLQRFAGHMNTIYEANRVVGIIDSMQQNIAGEMPRHRQRWGVPTEATWLEKVEILRDFARRRQAYMTEDLLGFFNVSGMQNLTVNVTGGGKVLVSEVEVPSPSYSGPYFKGIPIRLTAVPAPGYIFTGWQELGHNNLETFITLNADFTITAVFAPSGPPPKIVINEIHYNPSDAQGLDDDYEFFELVNNGAGSVNLQGFTISSGVDFTFPAATIAAGEYILLAKNAVTYNSLGCQVFQWVDSSLSNSGELLQIDDQNGNVIDAVAFDDEGGWPLEPDGGGPSLELTALSLDNALPASWHSSTSSGGSPCAVNSDGGPPVPPSPTPDTTIGLLITEIMYNPADGGQYEFLELKNVSGTPFDLGNAAFIEGITYTFAPGTTLNHNSFLVLAQDPTAFQTKYGFAPFNSVPFEGSLSNGGELLALVDGSGIPIFRVAYDDEGGWPTAPDGNGPSLVPVDPNANPDPHSFVNWRASTNAGGSPGADDPPPPPPTDTPTPTETLVPSATPTSTETMVPSATPTSTNTPTPTFTPTPGAVLQSVLANPGFEAGKSSWNFYAGGGGSFTVTNPAYEGSNAARLSINKPSTNIQLYQYGVGLKPFTTYRLTFAAKSSFGSDLKAYLQKHTSPYTNYGMNNVTFNLSSDWQIFTHEFTTIRFSNPVSDGRFRLTMDGMAQASEVYWIDAVALEEVGAQPPTATPTPTATGTPGPSPTATATSAASPTPTATSAPTNNTVINPGFEIGTRKWNFYSGGGGNFTTSAPGYSGNAAGWMKIAAPSNNVQLYQTNIKVQPNTRYRLTFAAKSTAGSDILVYLQKHTAPYTNYGLQSVLFNLTTEWQTFTVEFNSTGVVSGVSDGRLRLAMDNLAKANEIYWIDDVVFEELGP